MADVPAATGTRAAASERVRDAIVSATVAIVARDGVAAVTHRRVAQEAGVSLSSTTWHFETKTEILVAALRWTARREVARIGAIADRLGGRPFDAAAWADELADWLVGQVTGERDLAIALYRLQMELLGRPEAQAVHREWGEGLQALADRVLGDAEPLDTRLIAAALDGLRLSAISTRDADVEWLRAAVRRQLAALLG